MTNKLIQKLGKGKFRIETPNISDSVLSLDFNPVIEQFKLSGDFYLIHWQARPKGYRMYGIYSSKDDSYICCEHLPKSYGACQLLQLDDATAKIIPSAVIWFRGHLHP